MRSRQAAVRPSPEPSPASSEHGSLEDLTHDEEKLADKKAKDGGVLLDRELHLQETDAAKYFTLGPEIWRSVPDCAGYRHWSGTGNINLLKYE